MIARNGLKYGLIFHSGRGCQYAGKGYRQMLEENGILASMSRPGCPYDNSCAESFFATIKRDNQLSKICYNGRSKKRYVSIHRVIL
ncbi:MAG: hypothetical protein E7289_01335 [Lachnospiraceae bacterium]|nr:hypothetical protein [Lachnospiraceae bacterium]